MAGDRLRDDRLQPSPGPSHRDLRAAASVLREAQALDCAMQVSGRLPHLTTVLGVPDSTAVYGQCACGCVSPLYDERLAVERIEAWICEALRLDVEQDRRTDRLRALGVRV